MSDDERVSHKNKLMQLLKEGNDETLLRSNEFLATLQQRERELDKLRATLQSEFAHREQLLYREFADREKALKDREDSFRARTVELEKRSVLQQKEHEAQLLAIQSEMHQRVAEHQRAITSLERQREQFQEEFQKRIEAKAGEYVNDTLATLATAESKLYGTSSGWSRTGALSIAVGACLIAVLAQQGTAEVVANKDIVWPLMLYFGFKGVVLLGLVYALANFCRKLGRAYMHESLKIAERRHAIGYGKFYISAYGAGSDWDKVKEAFSHWNVNATSAFSEQPAPGDMQSRMNSVVSAVKAVLPDSKEAEEKI